MDGTELLALASALGGGSVGFVLGLRVCGPRLEVAWTERHPREIAEEVRAGKTDIRALTPRSQRLVLAELARLTNGLSLDASTEFLSLDGVAHRFTTTRPTGKAAR